MLNMDMSISYLRMTVLNAFLALLLLFGYSAGSRADFILGVSSSAESLDLLVLPNAQFLQGADIYRGALLSACDGSDVFKYEDGVLTCTLTESIEDAVDQNAIGIKQLHGLSGDEFVEISDVGSYTFVYVETFSFGSGGGSPGGGGPDQDGDGVPDSSDNCPAVANANQRNFDGDSQGDACDDDDDNDGVNDTQDAFPRNASETVDTDSDGIGNNADFDDDGDGVPDTVDVEPLNATNASELDLPVNSTYKGDSVKQNSAR